jgi:hypothetical protein
MVRCPNCRGEMKLVKLVIGPKKYMQRTQKEKAVLKCVECNHKEVFR